MHLCKDDCNFPEALLECGRNFEQLGSWILENTTDVNLTLIDCDGNAYSFYVSKYGLDPATVGRCACEEFEDDFNKGQKNDF